MKKSFVLSTLFCTLFLSGCMNLSHNSKQALAVEVALPAQNEIPVKLEWVHKYGQGSSGGYAKLVPAVNNNAIAITDTKGMLALIDKNSGKMLWHTKIKGGLSTSPTIADNSVYVGSANGSLYAFNLKDGSKRWEIKLDNQAVASPSVSHGVLLVKTVDGKLYAYSTDKGHSLWHYEESAPLLILRGASRPVIEYPYVISGFSNGKMDAFTLEKGQLHWQQTVAEGQGFEPVQRMVDISADPVIQNGVVYTASYQGNLSAISLATGDVLWEHQLSSYSGLSVGKKAVFITDADGKLWAFDKRNGDVLWQQPVLANHSLTAPTVMNNQIVVADDLGSVFWFSQNDGKVLAYQQLGSKIFSYPVVEDNRVYIYTASGKLAAFSLG